MQKIASKVVNRFQGNMIRKIADDKSKALENFGWKGSDLIGLADKVRRMKLEDELTAKRALEDEIADINTSNFARYAPWVATGGVLGTGIGALIGAKNKHTLLGTLLGLGTGAGVGGLGGYLFDKYQKDQRKQMFNTAIGKY